MEGIVATYCAGVHELDLQSSDGDELSIIYPALQCHETLTEASRVVVIFSNLLYHRPAGKGERGFHDVVVAIKEMFGIEPGRQLLRRCWLMPKYERNLKPWCIMLVSV